MNQSKRFLIRFSFLGFRYHGVQKQTHFLSIEARIEAEILKKLARNDFKIRFSSRTDALVSAREIYALIFFEKSCETHLFHESLADLPSDIKIQSIVPVDDNFILQNKIGFKEYHYHFISGEADLDVMFSPFVCHFKEPLDIDLMKKAAKLYEGKHSFKNFSYRAKPNSIWEREIFQSEIVSSSTLHQGQGLIDLPKCSTFIVSSAGFLRGQVRTMMAGLISVGTHKLSLEDLSHRLNDHEGNSPLWRVPAVGLVLNKTELITPF